MVKGIETLYDPETAKAAVLTPILFRDLLKVAGNYRNGLRNQAIVWMSFGSALRVSEIAHLKTKDVLRADGELIDEIKLPAAYTKTGRARKVYMLEDDHKESVKTYLLHRVEQRLRLGDSDAYLGLNPDSPLFMGRGSAGFTFKRTKYTKADGEISEYRACASMQQLFSGMFNKIDIKEGSSHSGRRTMATRLAGRGVDIEIIQYLLGHACKSQTMAYIDADPARMRVILTNVYGEF